MTKFLPSPCPYTDCQKTTVERKTKTKCFCHSCKRKVGYKVFSHVDDSQFVELTKLGRTGGEKTFMLSGRVPVRYKGKVGSVQLKAALDMAVKSGIIIL